MDDSLNRVREARIHILSQDTVNRLAAGEIIVRPCHALKELIENSLDASATQIRIEIEGGGLEVLDIVDNGCGIHHEDLPILCQRFTTSKLHTVEDLLSLQSLGFRGEALSSLSYASRVAVTTSRGHLDGVGYTCRYVDGVLASSITQVPFQHGSGTRIVAEALFYNLSVRRRALHPSTEYQRILSLVEQYAVHFPSVSFLCRQKRSRHSLDSNGLSRALHHTEDLFTPGTSHQPECFSSDQLARDQLHVIRSIYGSALAQALLPLQFDHPDLFKCHGWISRTKAPLDSLKKGRKFTHSFTLFINNRLVKHHAIKRQMEACLEQTPEQLNSSNSKPSLWVYLAVEFPTKYLDVNIHPCKKHVMFLHEDLFLEQLWRHVQTLLQTTLIPYNSVKSSAPPDPSNNLLSQDDQITLHQHTPLPHSQTSPHTTPSTLQVKRCRIDFSQSDIKSFFRSFERHVNHSLPKKLPEPSSKSLTYRDFLLESNNTTTLRLNPTEHPLMTMNPHLEQHSLPPCVEDLKAKIKAQAHASWGDAPFSARFIGMSHDPSKVFFQYNNRLLLLNLQSLVYHAIYQSLIHRLGNLPCVSFNPPLPLSLDLVLSRSSQPASQPASQPVSNRNPSSVTLKPESPIVDLFNALPKLANGLNLFFSIHIDIKKKLLWQFPLCCGRYFPGRFDSSVSTCVQKMLCGSLSCTTEKQFIEEMSNHLALYFSTLPCFPTSLDCDQQTLLRDLLEFVFSPCINQYPLFRIPSQCLVGVSPVIQEITTIEALYRVFERC